MPQLKLKPQRRTFEKVEARQLDRDKRTIEFSFSSEKPVKRWWGNEVLSHEKGFSDLERFNNGANVLFNHDWDRLVGVIEKAWIDPKDKRGYCAIRFSKRAEAETVMQDVEDGILKNVSFGYQVKSAKLTSSDETDGDTYTCKWMPFEVSFVTVPADHTVGVGREYSPEALRAIGIEEENVVEIEGELGARTLAEIAKRTENPLPPPVTDPKPPIIQETKTITVTEIKPKGDVMTPEEIKAMQEKMKQEERDRAGAIRSLCEKHKMDADFIRTLVDGGKTLEEARTAVLEKISTRQAPVSGTPDAPQLGLTEKEIRQFSFIKAIRALANPGDRRAIEGASFEREISEAGSKARGKDSEGFFVPQEVLNFGRRDLNKTTAGDGGYTVATEMVGFIEMLRKKSVVQRAGARVLNGLVGDLAIPKQTGGATAYWVGESANITESKQAFGQVAMSPKSLGAFTDISRKLLLQSSIDVENLVRADLATVIALAMDLAALYGTGADDQPTGLKDTTDLNTLDLGAAAPTFLEIIEMETKIASDDADVDNMKYIVNAIGRGGLKGTDKFSSAGQPVWEPNNTVNGYSALTSNQVASGDFWFGNWADLMLGFWSGLDLLVDPYTGGIAGTLRVIAQQDVDVAVRHAESFCRANNTL